MLIDVIITVAIVLSLILLWFIYTRPFGAEWVKMPKQARGAALKLLKLNKKDIFYDLGCGDGQLLLEAAPKVKQAIGIELDPLRFLIARARTKSKSNIKVIYGNLFKMPLKRATKAAVFLSPEANARLGKKLKKELSKKTLIASYKWPLSDLKLIKNDKKSRIFLYSV